MLLPEGVYPVNYSLPAFRAALAVNVCLLASFSLRGAATLYWDVTGADTWSTSGANKYWSTSLSGGTKQAWTANDNAYFSATGMGTGTFTVTLSGTVDVTNLTVAQGNITFSGSTLTFASGSTITVNSGATATINSVIAGTTPALTLAGGTLDLATGTTTIGALSVTASSVLDFNSSGSTLDITSLTVAAGATLTIDNWKTSGDVFHSTSNPGSTYLSQINFAGFSNGAAYNSSDDIVPVPEPAMYGAVFTLGCLGLAYWRVRRNCLMVSPQV
jgi:hypothetical protein